MTGYDTPDEAHTGLPHDLILPLTMAPAVLSDDHM